MSRLRRSLAAVLVLLLAAAPALPRGAGPRPRAPEHVVLIVVGGGVRPDDLAHRERMPALSAWSEQRDVVRVDRVLSGARSLDEALVRMLSVRSAGVVDDGVLRAAVPTIVDRAEGWFVSTPGRDTLGPATVRRPRQPGRPPAGRFAYGAGAFGEALAPYLEAMGRPLPLEGRAFELLQGLREMHLARIAPVLPPGVRLGDAAFLRVEAALFDELDRRALYVKGAAPDDTRALRMARTLLAVHRPRLLVVRLADAEVGSVSAARQERVLGEVDRGVAGLLAAIESDPELAATTAVVVVTDRARREKPEADGRLLEPSSPREDLGAVALLRGPGLVRRSVKPPRRLEDVGATIAAWLGLEPDPGAEGRAWAELTPR
ncbi:MAG: hypothetical protein R3F05_08675 [Planctomycetota bacterium]|nr:hypothetical protein [Planctomycetota bacterium]MCB9825723.1 hypothetical protein [Planctomycetota bacterium]MCB9901361.1 hypothetical protein [Planctomycetota bacterium]